MSRDTGRTNFKVQFRCCECGHLLEAAANPEKIAMIDEETGYKEQVEQQVFSKSGYEIGVVLLVHPCSYCIDNKTRSARQLIEAINDITKGKSS